MTDFIRVQGATEPLDVQLTVSPTQSSSGIDVELEIVDRNGAALDTPPAAAWLSQADWTVRVTGLGGLTTAGSPYPVRFKLTDGNGIGYAPTGRYPDRIVVVHP